MSSQSSKNIRASQYRKFQNQKYLVFRGFISHEIAKLMSDYLRDQKERSTFVTNYYPDEYSGEIHGSIKGDHQVPRSYAKYNDCFFDTWMHTYKSKLERISGLSLVPTYNYSRIYEKGAILKKHKDRDACEISATLCLGYDSKDAWPIFMGDTPIYLEPGDLVLYKGKEISHHRLEFEGEWHAQVFLHYNDKDGPHRSSNMYDKRISRWVNAKEK